MKTFLRGILYRVLWEFNKGVKPYYLRGLQWEEELLLPGSYVGLPNPHVNLSYRILLYMTKGYILYQGNGVIKCLKI